MTPSVAAFASGITAELRLLAADLLAIETCDGRAVAAPAFSPCRRSQAGDAWLLSQAPGVSDGNLTLLGTLAASQPAMRRLAFLAEVRPALTPDFIADLA
jgi:hypothetical protein